MTFFTNGLLALVNPSIPMNIKFSISPTMTGLPDIKNVMEEQLNSNPDIDVGTADFIAINDDIYYMIISSINTEEIQIRRNEFMFVKDNNLYSFEFTYPYADAELDNFYLDIIRSMKIRKAKYLLTDDGYTINED